jgi:hypothetical protein
MPKLTKMTDDEWWDMVNTYQVREIYYDIWDYALIIRGQGRLINYEKSVKQNQ